MSKEDQVEHPHIDTTDEAEVLTEVASEKGGAEAKLEDDSYESLQQKLEDAQQKSNDHWEQLLRTRAEMDNLRRRTQRDLDNAHKYALEKFVAELLPVMDSLEMALGAVSGESGEVEKFREGTELTINMFQKAFEKFNVQEVNPVGEKFNPELHQAMSMQETAETEPNTVLAVMQKGYVLNDRLVRPAMVMVSKAKS